MPTGNATFCQCVGSLIAAAVGAGFSMSTCAAALVFLDDASSHGGIEVIHLYQVFLDSPVPLAAA